MAVGGCAKARLRISSRMARSLRNSNRPETKKRHRTKCVWSPIRFQSHRNHSSTTILIYMPTPTDIPLIRSLSTTMTIQHPPRKAQSIREFRETRRTPGNVSRISRNAAQTILREEVVQGIPMHLLQVALQRRMEWAQLLPAPMAGSKSTS